MTSKLHEFILAVSTLTCLSHEINKIKVPTVLCESRNSDGYKCIFSIRADKHTLHSQHSSALSNSNT